MIRRSFFGALAAGVAGLFVGKAVDKVFVADIPTTGPTIKPNPDRDKALYDYFANGQPVNSGHGWTHSNFVKPKSPAHLTWDPDLCHKFSNSKSKWCWWTGGKAKP